MAVTTRLRNSYRTLTGTLGFCEKCWAPAKVKVNESGQVSRYCTTHFEGKQLHAAGHPMCENCGVEVRDWKYSRPGWRSVTCRECGGKVVGGDVLDRPEDAEDEPVEDAENVVSEDAGPAFVERVVNGRRRLLLASDPAAGGVIPLAGVHIIEGVETDEPVEYEDLDGIEDDYLDSAEDLPPGQWPDPQVEIEPELAPVVRLADYQDPSRLRADLLAAELAAGEPEDWTLDDTEFMAELVESGHEPLTPAQSARLGALLRQFAFEDELHEHADEDETREEEPCEYDPVDADLTNDDLFECNCGEYHSRVAAEERSAEILAELMEERARRATQGFPTLAELEDGIEDEDRPEDALEDQPCRACGGWHTEAESAAENAAFMARLVEDLDEDQVEEAAEDLARHPTVGDRFVERDEPTVGDELVEREEATIGQSGGRVSPPPIPAALRKLFPDYETFEDVDHDDQTEDFRSFGGKYRPTHQLGTKVTGRRRTYGSILPAEDPDDLVEDPKEDEPVDPRHWRDPLRSDVLLDDEGGLVPAGYTAAQWNAIRPRCSPGRDEFLEGDDEGDDEHCRGCGDELR